MVRCVLLGLGLLSAPVVSGLEPGVFFSNFGRSNGLSSSSVTSILQDTSGFLWFATQDGLDRWDGYQMKVWKHAPFDRRSLSNNLVQTLYLDKDGSLWLGTYGGLNHFFPESEVFRSFRHEDGRLDSLSSAVVTSILRDRAGNLWVGTLDGLNEGSGDLDSFRVFTHTALNPRSLADNTVRALYQDGTGRLWVGTARGLDWYDPQEQFFHHVDLAGQGSRADVSVMSLGEFGDSALWCGVWGKGLVRYDPLSGTSQTFSLPDNRVYSLSKGDDDQINVATWGGGLVVFDRATHKSFSLKNDPELPDSLAHDVVYTSFKDSAGVWWIATNGGGVSNYNSRMRQFQHILPTPEEKGGIPFPAGKVTTLVQDPDGSIWAGVYNGGLVHIGSDHRVLGVWRHDPKDPASLSNDILNNICFDPLGRLWIATNEGLNLFDKSKGKFRRFLPDPRDPGSLPDEIVIDLSPDGKDGVWIATYRAGLWHGPWPDRRGPVHVYRGRSGDPHALPSDLVYFVRRDSEGRVWVGTNGGLALYREKTDDFQVWTYDVDDLEGLPSDSTNAFLEDNRKRLWFATNGGGLAQYIPDSGAFQHWGRDQGLDNLAIRGLIQDKDGLIWLSCADGLYSFQPNQNRFQRYGRRDGLINTEFSYGALAARDGSLYWGGTSGIEIRLRGQTVAETPQPPIALTALSVMGTSRPVPRVLKLAWWQNSFEVRFALLNFLNTSGNFYKKELVGFDHGWSPQTKDNWATYTNLPAGRYQFRVQGQSGGGSWSETQHSLIVEVESAPWASWYAWSAYGLIVLGLLYLVYKVRVARTLNVKVRELEKVRSELEAANARLDLLSRQDGLTGVPNRRALDSWLEAEWARALRQKQAVSALMLDIDFFKRYNDYYGHLEGDSCLKRVADTLMSCLHRNTDFCARFGGEEFVIILHDTEASGALLVARRIQHAISDLGLPHQMSSVSTWLTVSIGAASLVPTPDSVASDLIQRADKALYKAKSAGRNRVESE